MTCMLPAVSIGWYTAISRLAPAKGVGPESLAHLEPVRISSPLGLTRLEEANVMA